MLKTNTIVNYYFSGTGNTKALVEHFSELLKQKGYNSITRKIEEGWVDAITEDYTLGLMFPVAIQSTLPLVWNFVKKLPWGNGRDVFMFDTMQSFSGGVVGPMKKLLTQKGYNCIAAKEFTMSSSMNSSVAKVEAGRRKNVSAYKEVEQYVSDLIDGTSKWGRISVLSDIIRSISSKRGIWTATSQGLSVSDQCVQCGICVKNCPVNAITLLSGKIVIDYTACNVCMRCVSKCPKSAILYKNKTLQLQKR